MELYKNIMFYLILSIGSICILCLFIAALIRCFTILLDHLKVANFIRKAMIEYAKNKSKER